jgi:hypothetical protein
VVLDQLHEGAHEPVGAAAHDRKPDLMQGPSQRGQLKRAAGVVGRQAGVQDPRREQVAELAALKAGLEPAARAAREQRAEAAGLPHAEPASQPGGQARRMRGLQLGAEQLADHVHARPERLEVLQIGPPVGGRQLGDAALGVPVSDDRAAVGQGRGGHHILGVDVLEPALAQLRPELGPGGREMEERVPARERVVPVARPRQLLGRDSATGELVALEHLDPPPGARQIGGCHEPVVPATDDDRIGGPADAHPSI